MAEISKPPYCLCAYPDQQIWQQRPYSSYPLLPSPRVRDEMMLLLPYVRAYGCAAWFPADDDGALSYQQAGLHDDLC